MVTGATSLKVDPDELVVTCPFSVIVDTREQAPFRFTGIDDSETGKPLAISLVTDVALTSGDYSISGMESLVSIERKSPGDFRGSITADRDRFEREMERLAKLEYAAVVIEADWKELLEPAQHSRVSPTAIARTIQSWSIRYGVHFFPMPGRRFAEVWTFRLLSMFWRQKQAALKTNGIE